MSVIAYGVSSKTTRLTPETVKRLAKERGFYISDTEVAKYKNLKTRLSFIDPNNEANSHIMTVNALKKRKTLIQQKESLKHNEKKQSKKSKEFSFESYHGQTIKHAIENDDLIIGKYHNDDTDVERFMKKLMETDKFDFATELGIQNPNWEKYYNIFKQMDKVTVDVSRDNNKDFSKVRQEVVTLLGQTFARDRRINYNYIGVLTFSENGVIRTKHIPLNTPTMRKHFRTILSDVDFEETDEYVVENKYGSGSDADLNEYWSKTFDRELLYVTLLRYHPDGVSGFRKTVSGAFFPYLCKCDIDLTKYGIYKTVNPKNYELNCFIDALKQSKELTEEELFSAISIIKTRDIPLRLIKIVGEKLKINFKIQKSNSKWQDEQQLFISKGNNNTIVTPNDPSFTRQIELVLREEHYMINEPVPITPFYAFNKDLIDARFEDTPIADRQLIKDFSGNIAKPLKLNSFLTEMFKLGLFVPIKSCEQDILQTVEFNNLQDYDDLKYDDSCINVYEYEKPNTVAKSVFFADFESYIKVTPKGLKEHHPFMVSVGKIKFEKGNPNPTDEEIKTFDIVHHEDIVVELLDSVWNKSIIYFHNLKYDLTMFINHPRIKVLGLTDRMGVTYQCHIEYFPENYPEVSSKQFFIRDTYVLVPGTLASFKNKFGLEVEKECMPYSAYNEETLKKPFVDYEYIEKCFTEECKINGKDVNNQIDTFFANVDKLNAVDESGELVDLIKYAKFYCEADVKVLMYGINKFCNNLKKELNIWLYNFLSISGVGYQYIKQNQCLDGVAFLSGKPQDFISRCISGGRVMVCNNEKVDVQGKISDFDAVSLYPSAMEECPGIPKGKPKIIPDKYLNKLYKNEIPKISDSNKAKRDKACYFFIEVDIESIVAKADKDQASFNQVEYPFPLVFEKDDIKTREARAVNCKSKTFVDKPVKGFYLDKCSLEDLITFYDVEYKIKRGYYYNEGFNTGIKTIIRKLFDLRIMYKKEGNPVQETIKLILNSVYGKSILKPIDSIITVIDKSEIDKYIYQNHNFITEINTHDNTNKAYVKRKKSIDDHFNNPVFGCIVLSYSKRIMNRVICTAHQNGIPIFYQDTDSMHLFTKDIPELSEIYNIMYNKTLIGNDLGQFHTDFNFPSGKRPNGEIYSKRLIALGKKCYIDVLRDENENDSDEYHIRMKGIPSTVIRNHAAEKKRKARLPQIIKNGQKNHGISVEMLYERMLNNKTENFNLLNGKICFQRTKTFETVTKNKFERKIEFKGNYKIFTEDSYPDYKLVKFVNQEK